MTLAAYIYLMCFAAHPSADIPKNFYGGMKTEAACRDYAAGRFKLLQNWGMNPAEDFPNDRRTSSGGVSIVRGK